VASTSDHATLKITRRGLLVQGAALLACATALPRGAFGQAEQQDVVEVKTECGGLRGARDRGVAIFKGVPASTSLLRVAMSSNLQSCSCAGPREGTAS
jgi:hypothetical protein